MVCFAVRTRSERHRKASLGDLPSVPLLRNSARSSSVFFSSLFVSGRFRPFLKYKFLLILGARAVLRLWLVAIVAVCPEYRVLFPRQPCRTAQDPSRHKVSQDDADWEGGSCLFTKLEDFQFRAFHFRICQRLALRDAEVFDVFEHHGRDVGSLWQFDVNEFCTIHIIEDEAGP
jgi:hypothetical protein